MFPPVDVNLTPSVRLTCFWSGTHGKSCYLWYVLPNLERELERVIFSNTRSLLRIIQLCALKRSDWDCCLPSLCSLTFLCLLVRSKAVNRVAFSLGPKKRNGSYKIMPQVLESELEVILSGSAMWQIGTAAWDKVSAPAGLLCCSQVSRKGCRQQQCALLTTQLCCCILRGWKCLFLGYASLNGGTQHPWPCVWSFVLHPFPSQIFVLLFHVLMAVVGWVCLKVFEQWAVEHDQYKWITPVW